LRWRSRLHPRMVPSPPNNLPPPTLFIPPPLSVFVYPLPPPPPAWGRGNAPSLPYTKNVEGAHPYKKMRTGDDEQHSTLAGESDRASDPVGGVSAMPHPSAPPLRCHSTPLSPLLRRHPTPAPSSPHRCHLRAGGDPVPLPPIPDSLIRCCYHYCPAPNFRLDGGQKYRIKTFTLNFF